jgi:hypothetical protein
MERFATQTFDKFSFVSGHHDTDVYSCHIHSNRLARRNGWLLRTHPSPKEQAN